LNDRVRPGRPNGDLAIENRLGRLVTSHGFGDRVGLLLVSVARMPHSIRELRAPALLHDMSRFVRGELHVGFAAEGDPISRGVGQRTHALVSACRGSADRGACTSDIVAPERSLDTVEMRKRLARTRYAGARGFVQAGGALMVVFARASSAAGAFCLREEDGRWRLLILLPTFRALELQARF
jgi:hypothetical protein